MEQDSHWMQTFWRPAMGWMYMLICLLDMAVFPICWSILQAMTHQAITQWNPLTLQGAGLFHIAMGAVLGITAFGRTQEKINGATNGGSQIPTAGPQSGATTPGATPTGFVSPATVATAPTATATPAFGSAPVFGSAPATTVTTGFGGKKAPAPQDDPIQ
jgi:hypothetical protein